MRLVLLKEINTKSISYNNYKDKIFFLKEDYISVQKRE